MASIIQFQHAAKIHGGGRDIVAEVMTITPDDAVSWLRCNKNNRTIRKRHVQFLASEILSGNWQVNGQAIVIADNEQVLDGQHRLFAIIESGKAIQSLVVYGITEGAFRTIDTGAVRTGADALCLHFPDIAALTVRVAATAVQWCVRLEKESVHSHVRVSNTDTIKYVQEHMSLLQCADTLQSFPKDARPLSLGLGTALYEMFTRKKAEMADEFIQRLYTGEALERTDVEYVLRQSFIRDAQRTMKLPAAVKLKMVIKGWNWRRRGMDTANHQTVVVQANDDQRIRIF